MVSLYLAMDYRETFYIDGIGFQKYPVYALNKNGRIVNFKAEVYPSSTSARRYTRLKRLKHRSQQERLFDMLINIGYFNGLGEIVREMPILIENSKRPEGLDKGLFFLCDYYFANIRLAVELDSDLHDEISDNLRDRYLENLGIRVFRMKNFQLERTQKTKFHELTELLKSYTTVPEHPTPLIFTNDLYKKLDTK